MISDHYYFLVVLNVNCPMSIVHTLAHSKPHRIWSIKAIKSNSSLDKLILFSAKLPTIRFSGQQPANNNKQTKLVVIFIPSSCHSFPISIYGCKQWPWHRYSDTINRPKNDIFASIEWKKTIRPKMIQISLCFCCCCWMNLCVENETHKNGQNDCHMETILFKANRFVQRLCDVD